MALPLTIAQIEQRGRDELIEYLQALVDQLSPTREFTDGARWLLKAAEKYPEGDTRKQSDYTPAGE